MKVRIVTTVNVDPEKWALEYGIDLADVREDVKDYFASYPQMQVDSLGCAPDNAFDFRDRK